MTDSSSGTSPWTRLMRSLKAWAWALDTDAHEIAVHRIEALERRLAAVEAEVHIVRASGGEP